MAPRLRCICGKEGCFTCHRRRINLRYQEAHPRLVAHPEPRHSYRDEVGKFAPEPSDEELDRRALVMMGRSQDAR